MKWTQPSSPDAPQARQDGVVSAHNLHSSARRREGLLCTRRPWELMWQMKMVEQADLQAVSEHLMELDSRIERGTHRIARVCRTIQSARNWRLPGIGPLTAPALVATRRFRTDGIGRLGWAWCLGNIQWWQGALGRDLETRQSICADAADSWGARRRATSRAANRYAGAVVVRTHTPQRHQCRRGGLSQQKCPSDLGLVGP